MKFICVKSRTGRVYIIGFNYKHKMTSIMVATLVNHALSNLVQQLRGFLIAILLKTVESIDGLCLST